MVTPLARGAVLRAGEAAPAADWAVVAGPAGVLVLAPHPDDETLACGGAIADAAAAGRRVVVACVTRGDRSHASRRCPPDRLAALRRRELREAARHLGVAEVIWLGHPDQGAPRQLPQAQLGRLAEAAARHDLRRIWTCWAEDPHCDHQATAAAALGVARALGLPPPAQMPVWGRFIETAPAPGTRLLRLAPSPAAAARKARALGAHRSQMTRLIPDDPEGFVMTEATQRHFLDTPELFLIEAAS